ncbi:SDR family oxidoreductase [Phormidium sp. LEGE 05292]|uniref:SDR family NAD(P)-dependent oxidoreductase n=1 Tax=[Phormidium] sp. LEGE 05292 TaxID=767427 RepID=UPI0018830F64|nr:SDR family oxidoreductase [Phormidium sp. LEGE 05292]MBE9225496.1 SDR family oxidoreductase [Phormidium sp. LEGE 05292]
MELQGKTAIVTGSARGIGEGIAVCLAREGAKVVINSRKEQDCQETVERIRAAGGTAIAIAADVAKEDQVTAMVAETVRQFGRVDILVNNAGIESPPTLLKDISEEVWDRVMSVNVKGVFFCCKAVIPQMMAQGKGKIINVSSVAGVRMTFFGGANYTASKYAVTGLTNHLAWELADSHINVNTIAPGAVLTPLAEQNTTQEYRDMTTKRLIPLGRWCTIEDLGNAAVFFASDRSDMITGQTLAVDGGALTGFGEDLRPVIRQRMADMQAAHDKH